MITPTYVRLLFLLQTYRPTLIKTTSPTFDFKSLAAGRLGGLPTGTEILAGEAQRLQGIIIVDLTGDGLTVLKNY